MTNRLDDMRRQAADVKKVARTELVNEIVDNDGKVSAEVSGIHAEASLEGDACLELRDKDQGVFKIPAGTLKSLHTFIGSLIEEV